MMRHGHFTEQKVRTNDMMHGEFHFGLKPDETFGILQLE